MTVTTGDVIVWPGLPQTPDTTKPYARKTSGTFYGYFETSVNRFKGDGTASARKYFYCQATPE